MTHKFKAILLPAFIRDTTTPEALRVNVLKIGRRSSVGKSERRAKGGVGKKCVKIRQRRFRLMFALKKFEGRRKLL